MANIRPTKRLRDAAERVASEGAIARIPSSAPLRDSRIDDQVRALPGYPDLVAAIRRSRRLRSLYGPGEAERLALAWVYGRMAGVGGSDPWRLYWSQVTEPTWRFVSVANLSNFDSDADVLRFPDSLTIRTRSRPELTSILGWPIELLERTIGADWLSGHGGYGRYVIVHDESVNKDPANIVLGSTGRNVQTITRLLLALRLSGAGDLSAGTVFTTRTEAFPISIGGVAQSMSAATFQPARSEMRLLEGDTDAVARLYGMLVDFETHHGHRQQSITTALSRFTAGYERRWTSDADRLVDDMIGLEALVGTSGPDLSYTLAIRSSGLLADNDRDRVALFDQMRSFYATRSTLVHGGSLKRRHHADIRREPELRDILRRLLRGFLNLCFSSDFYPGKSLLEGIDTILLDAGERTRLQAELAAGPPATASTSAGLRIVAQWSDQPPSSAVVSVPN